MKRRNPPFVHAYENRHGTVVYYIRKPGCPKVRLHIPPDVLPWSPTFMSVYEATLANAPSAPEIGASYFLAQKSSLKPF